jgi:hypothetical protein
LKIIHALIWLSLTTYSWDNYDAICGSFYNGVILLNDAMREKNEPLVLSSLAKTWIFDVDGTLVKHNGYWLDGEDTLLEGAKEFLANLPQEDFILLLTARLESELPDLKKFLRQNKIRYNALRGGVPVGERILVNDRKLSGLQTAFAVNKIRDEKMIINYKIDPKK